LENAFDVRNQGTLKEIVLPHMKKLPTLKPKEPKKIVTERNALKPITINRAD
jgi:hypothetical protein